MLRSKVSIASIAEALESERITHHPPRRANESVPSSVSPIHNIAHTIGGKEGLNFAGVAQSLRVCRRWQLDPPALNKSQEAATEDSWMVKDHRGRAS